jgi:NhaC family Na+:H+ antiporter
MLYAPLAFACWLSPAIGIIYAQTGWFSKRAESDDADPQNREPATTALASSTAGAI